MKIKELADKLTISTRAIRFYEEKGLLSPTKQANNQYRTFTEKDIWRLQTIISLREAGMPLSDIKKALEVIDAQDKEEFQYYLELQRSVMMSQWLEIKQIIETTDHMINLLYTEKSLPIEAIYALAEGSKKLREQRKGWKDKSNFDHRAFTHDDLVTDNSGAYMDYERALNLIVQWVSPLSGEKGLDIGTGTGNLAGKFIEQGVHMSGVDQSKEMLRQCKRKYPALETRLGNFLAIPYLEGEFDFIVSSFAFHHLNHEQQLLALEEIRRVLKPHGRICVADLMVVSKHTRAHTIHDRVQGSAASGPNDTEDYLILPQLLEWFESHGYATKHHQFNDFLHLIYAIPIR